MLSKQKLIESIKAMPEDKFEDIDILIERIVMLEKIENAEKDIEEGRVYTTEEAKRRLERWLK